MKSISRLLLAGLLLVACLCSACSQEPAPLVSADGVEIAYEARGTGSPALVFVHGWSNDRSVWADQLQTFASDRMVVAPDLAGFGQSGNDREDWTIPAFAGDVKAVMDRLELNDVVLVGFSMGGGVVLETANQLPGRVRGVVLVDSFGDPERKFTPEMLTMVDSTFMDIVTNPAPEKLGYFYRTNREEAYQRVLSMIENNPKVGWRESLQGFAKWNNERLIPSLQSLACPLVVINSEQEQTNVESFETYVPEIDIHIVPDVGHLVMWDAPRTFDSLLSVAVRGMETE